MLSWITRSDFRRPARLVASSKIRMRGVRRQRARPPIRDALALGRRKAWAPGQTNACPTRSHSALQPTLAAALAASVERVTDLFALEALACVIA